VRARERKRGKEKEKKRDKEQTAYFFEGKKCCLGERER